MSLARNHYFKFYINLISSSYHLKQDYIVLPIDGNILELKKRINSIILPFNKQELIIFHKNKELLNNINLKYYFNNSTNVYNLIVYRNTNTRFLLSVFKMFF